MRNLDAWGHVSRVLSDEETYGLHAEKAMAETVKKSYKPTQEVAKIMEPGYEALKHIFLQSQKGRELTGHLVDWRAVRFADIELIKYYMPGMDSVTHARAMRTIAHLSNTYL